MATRSRRSPNKSPQRPAAPAPARNGNPAALGPLTGRWVLAGKDGRLTAYARTGGGLLRWTEETPGGPGWSGPDFFPADGLTDLSVGQGPDGYAHFTARRRARDGDTETLTYHHAVQYQSGRPIGPWESLGTLYQNVEMSLRGGPPAITVDAQGAAHVFVRNNGRGIHMKRQDKKGTWGRWEDLKGSMTFEGGCASSTADGRTAFAAPGEKGLTFWAQSAPGGPLKMGEVVPYLARDGSLATLETAPGRLTRFWHAADGSGVFAHREGAGVMALGGGPGLGAVAAVRALVDGYDCTVLAHRALDGRTALAAYPTENEAAGLWWTGIGEECPDSPALAVDARGLVVIASISAGGELLVNRQKDSSGLSLGRWQRF
ncbi:hypothetical protein EDD96_1445 [Streptomyces sp. Ag109_G2-6]|uniref:hypothetical protein n=1 Tax=Streptomyces TaxID=1883 RepID=UPI0009A4C926|nr:MULTISPECIES: hypothetical protein [Streptomyces]RPF44902.1 hypothetical protein EDD96_1445 [Streptomyces sp. Ag109_G2-6]